MPNLPNVSNLFIDKKKLLIVGVVGSVALLYIATNIWVFQYARSHSVPPGHAIIDILQKRSFSGTGDGKQQTQPSPSPRSAATRSTAPPTPTPRPTPTPTPVQGPGRHACDPDGVCGVYSDQMRKDFCPTTFADPNCLGQCSDSSKRCRR